MTAIARRLDATEGQVWSLAIGLVVAVVLALAGIPPVVHHAKEPLASSSPASRESGVTRTHRALVPATVDASPLPPVTASSGGVRPPSVGGGPASASTPAPQVAPAPFGTVNAIASVDTPLGGIAAAGRSVYVATDGTDASQVFRYDGSGRRTGTFAIAGQPERHERGITALAASEDGSLLAADAASARILRLDAETGRQSTIATIIDLPSCVLAPGAPQCEPGLEDHAPLLTGVTAAADGTILVADSAQATVWRIAPGGKPEVWSQSVQQASGDGPTAIAITPDDGVVVTVGTDLNPTNPTAAAVYRIPVDGDGSAGEPVLLAKLARGDAPTGIAVTPAGRIFVALHATSTIVVLNGDGGEVTRLRSPSISAPAALGLSSAAELVATTRTADAGSQILRISIAESP
jgi:sugar lactone lactonase YvrE